MEEVAPRFGSAGGSSAAGGNTFIFFFCALGGFNSGGAVSLVDTIQTGLGNALQSLSIAPVPRAAMRGGEVNIYNLQYCHVAHHHFHWSHWAPPKNYYQYYHSVIIQ